MLRRDKSSLCTSLNREADRNPTAVLIFTSLPTESQLKRAAHKAKFAAIRNELAELNAQAWRHRNAEHTFTFHPVPIDDPQLSSRLFGPQTKSVQWEPTSR